MDIQDSIPTSHKQVHSHWLYTTMSGMDSHVPVDSSAHPSARLLGMIALIWRMLNSPHP